MCVCEKYKRVGVSRDNIGVVAARAAADAVAAAVAAAC